MFLLVTAAVAFLGIAYAGLVDRRFGLKDWRRWTALAPFWVLAVGVGLALQTVNMTDLTPQAVQAFAIGSLSATVIDSSHALWRRRAEASTTRPERADSKKAPNLQVGH